MSTYEWPAKDYAIGSYIQSSIADNYLKYLAIKPTDHVLDIGCGNGAYSRNILDKIPQGSFLGIDASENMLNLAREEIAPYPNAKVQKDDVLTMKFDNQFDYIVSFWCLQWCASHIDQAFQNIYRALKSKGKVLTLFPSGEDSFISSYEKIKASGDFSCLDDFKPPVTKEDFDHLQDRLGALPFNQIKVEYIQNKLLLPSLDIFRKFVNGIVFFYDQIPIDQIAKINEAIVNAYEKECQDKYQNEYWLNLPIYLVQAEK